MYPSHFLNKAFPFPKFTKLPSAEYFRLFSQTRHSAILHPTGSGPAAISLALSLTNQFLKLLSITEVCWYYPMANRVRVQLFRIALLVDYILPVNVINWWYFVALTWRATRTFSTAILLLAGRWKFRDRNDSTEVLLLRSMGRVRNRLIIVWEKFFKC